MCSIIPSLAGPFHHSVFVVEVPFTELPSPNTHSNESTSANGTRDTFLNLPNVESQLGFGFGVMF